jgi:hypothetical protein
VEALKQSDPLFATKFHHEAYADANSRVNRIRMRICRAAISANSRHHSTVQTSVQPQMLCFQTGWIKVDQREVDAAWRFRAK